MRCWVGGHPQAPGGAGNQGAAGEGREAHCWRYSLWHRRIEETRAHTAFEEQTANKNKDGVSNTAPPGPAPPGLWRPCCSQVSPTWTARSPLPRGCGWPGMVPLPGSRVGRAGRGRRGVLPAWARGTQTRTPTWGGQLASLRGRGETGGVWARMTSRRVPPPLRGSAACP